MKILVVKIAAIGDVVMTLPLLPAIRAQHPDCHLTWICGRQVESLLTATKEIDRLIAVDEFSLYKGNFPRRIAALLRIWKEIAGRRYDLCLICHPDPRYQWIPFPARCKEKRSLTRTRGRPHPIPGRYHAEEYIRLFSQTERGPDALLQFPKLALPPPPPLTLEGPPLIAIAPGGAKNILADDALRRWPIESYAALAKQLKDLPVRLAITGSSSDEWVKPYFSDIPHIDLIGELSLLDLVSFLKCCRLFITHDSGPLHLAKLADCPTIALFGPTMPSEKVGLNEKFKVFWGGETLPCRPCYDGKTYAQCTNNLCLKSISPQQVFLKAAEILHFDSSFSC